MTRTSSTTVTQLRDWLRFLTDRDPDTGISGFQLMIYESSRHANGLARGIVPTRGFQKLTNRSRVRGVSFTNSNYSLL